MDNFLKKFPELGKGIFDNLDDENLVQCKEISRSWFAFTDGERFYWTRAIRKYTDNIEEFKETWKKVMERTNIEMIKELGLAVKYFLKSHPLQCSWKDCNHRVVPYSPLHLGTEAGNSLLCRFILGRIEDKNPKAIGDLGGWTPLHEAAQIGNLEICLMIMDSVDEKSPKIKDGTTPLHVAAENGHL